MSAAPGAARESEWLAPRTEQEGLARYITTLRERWWIVAVITVVAVAGALAYLSVTPKTYETHADMLVTPVSQGDQTTAGLGLIQDSNDPTRDVSTAARFITTTAVAQRVVDQLHLDQPARDLLGDVTAEPVAQSSIVTIIAKSEDPQRAAALANAFAQATVADRTAQLRKQLDQAIPLLRNRLQALPQSERQGAGSLAGRLAALEALRGVPDPTLSQIVKADVPVSASSPRPKLTLAAAIIAGLILGVGAAFAAQALDPRLRSEEQLRSLYRVPILARVPLESGTRGSGALEPRRLSGAALDSYRTLRATLAASRSDDFRSRSVLVTGSSPGEGKSTTAINLAYSLVQAGNRVILIEADMHKPTIGPALGCKPRFGIASVLIRQVSLEDALISTEAYGPDLQLLLVDRPGIESADRLSLPTARQLVSEAEALADFVVVDSPPLTEVVDALPLAQQVGDIVVVVRVGKSKLPKLADLGEILSQHDLEPAGVALIGVERQRGAGYYYASREGESGVREPSAT